MRNNCNSLTGRLWNNAHTDNILHSANPIHHIKLNELFIRYYLHKIIFIWQCLVSFLGSSSCTFNCYQIFFLFQIKSIPLLVVDSVIEKIENNRKKITFEMGLNIPSTELSKLICVVWLYTWKETHLEV